MTSRKYDCKGLGFGRCCKLVIQKLFITLLVPASTLGKAKMSNLPSIERCQCDKFIANVMKDKI